MCITPLPVLFSLLFPSHPHSLGCHPDNMNVLLLPRFVPIPYHWLFHTCWTRKIFYSFIFLNPENFCGIICYSQYTFLHLFSQFSHSIHNASLPPPTKLGWYCFRPCLFVCLFVCLSVCLFVNNFLFTISVVE